MQKATISPLTIENNVRQALDEDIGDGDVTAQLIPAEQRSTATVITREPAIICGTRWFDEVFRQLDPAGVSIEWKVHDGDRVQATQVLCTLTGPSRALLTGERTALNFLQFLSGVATRCGHYAELVRGTDAQIRDTRKTIPGLRLAEKYAVRTGGCTNHRFGLYDAFLIKENHIAASDGKISKVIERARAIAEHKPIVIEVETLEQLREALAATPDVILLDNMAVDEMREAVRITAKRVKLEASGGVDERSLRAIAETGVDYIAIGTLTKDIKAIDLSMRFQT